MSEVRALLFDTFGTLVDWRAGLITQLEQWGRARDIAADWPSLVLAWRRDHVPALAKVRTGQREWANYDELQGETMRQLASQFGLPALSDDTLDHLARMWQSTACSLPSKTTYVLTKNSFGISSPGDR